MTFSIEKFPLTSHGVPRNIFFVKLVCYNGVQKDGLPDGSRLLKGTRQMGGKGDSKDSGTWGYHPSMKWDRI